MKANILIVEDEVLIANLTKSYIINAGYNCIGIALDFKESVSMLDSKRIDLVLLDITLPGSKSGIDLAHYINEHHQIPFLFLTSHSDKATIAELTKTKPVSYLSKPFKQIDIITTLNIYFQNKENALNDFKLTIGKKTHIINLDHLLYIKSDHVYVKLIFVTNELLLRASINDILNSLPKHSLKRINRGEAINPKYIKKVNKRIVDFENLSFKISEKYLKDFDF